MLQGWIIVAASFAYIGLLFAIAWFVTLFCLLPVGLGGPLDPDTGAPLNPRLGFKFLIATGTATVAFAVFAAGYLVAALITWRAYVAMPGGATGRIAAVSDAVGGKMPV